MGVKIQNFPIYITLFRPFFFISPDEDLLFEVETSRVNFLVSFNSDDQRNTDVATTADVTTYKFGVIVDCLSGVKLLICKREFQIVFLMQNTYEHININTKYFLLDKYFGYLYATGEETISSEPIEEKGWIYPTESTKPIAGAPDEFRLTPYHTLQASTIKGTPVVEST